MIKILPSITSIDGVDWRSMIREIKELGLAEIAVFLTGMDKSSRGECFQLLAEIPGLQVPFVHARSDMDEAEYQQWIDQFDTQKFNLHPPRSWPLKYPLSAELRSKIYLENSGHLPIPEELRDFAGLVVDTSHLINDHKVDPESYQQTIELIKHYPVGANHLSPVLDSPITDQWGTHFDTHLFSDLKEYDYLKDLPKNCFGELGAIEVINPVKVQLEIKQYLEGCIFTS